MAELVDALDLGSSGETRASSSLAFRTNSVTRGEFPPAAEGSPLIQHRRPEPPGFFQMQVNVEAGEGLEKRLKVDLPAERLEQEIETSRATKLALAERAAGLPREPGVYIFKGRLGRILYIGKAKSLRARVRSYLGAAGDGVEHQHRDHGLQEHEHAERHAESTPQTATFGAGTVRRRDHARA